MKLFKIDEKVLFEKYFFNMTVKDFFSLDHIPKDVEEKHMRHIGEFLEKVKAENADNKEIDVNEFTIGEVFGRLFIENELEV